MTRRILFLLMVSTAVLVLASGVVWAEWATTGSGTGNGAAGTWDTSTTAPPGPEVCDGIDNDMNGDIDDGLNFCSDGVAAPNTDGAVCLDGFSDLDGDSANGCEVALSPTSP